jgi:hypothetical protein
MADDRDCYDIVLRLSIETMDHLKNAGGRHWRRLAAGLLELHAPAALRRAQELACDQDDEEEAAGTGI